MTTIARPEMRERDIPEVQLSARDRLRQGVPPKTRDVDVPGLGRFRVRELRQREIEEINEPLVTREFDGDGKVTAKTDSRGHHARAIAFALINDDGSNVYANPLEEGVPEIQNLLKAQSDALWEAVDSLNGLSKGAREEMGKASAGTPKNDGG